MPRGHILDLRWNALLSDFRRCGLTHAEFCRRRGISIHSFRKHLYQTPRPQSLPTPTFPPPQASPLRSSPSPSLPIPPPPAVAPTSPSN